MLNKSTLSAIIEAHFNLEFQYINKKIHKNWMKWRSCWRILGIPDQWNKLLVVTAWQRMSVILSCIGSEIIMSPYGDDQKFISKACFWFRSTRCTPRIDSLSSICQAFYYQRQYSGCAIVSLWTIRVQFNPKSQTELD